MSKSYSMVPLGDLIRHRSEFIEIDDFKTYRRCRVQLHAQGIIERDVVQGVEIRTKKQQVCSAGEFLVAEIDAKVGGFGIVPDNLDGAIVSSHYFLFDLDETVLNRHFLEFFVRTPTFMEQVRAQGTTNYAAIRPGDVLGYEVPLPPLEEQRRIVARIEELAVRIEEARGLRREGVEEVDKFLTRTLSDAFKPHEDNMALIGVVFKVTTGSTPSRGNPLYWGGEIKWVSSGEVAFCRITDTVEKITELGLANSSAKVYPPNTVLIAMIGQGKTRGQVAILDCYAATNQNVAGIHVYDTIHNPEYVYWWLRSRYYESRLTETGTAQPALSGERVKQMLIPLPPSDEQHRIVTCLDCIQAKIDVLKRLQAETSAELDALLPSILDKAFKGDL
jgi:type I restriction enzyme, S subunit